MRHVPKFVVLQLLRGYKWAVSPLFPPACRFLPTCSEYAMEAVERYGALRGGWMALMRLLRCHPLAHGGYDPVVRVGEGFEGAVKRPRGLKPAFIGGASSQRLKRCATQNQLRHEDHRGDQNHLGRHLDESNDDSNYVPHPEDVRHPKSQPNSLSGVAAMTQSAV